MVWWRCVDTLDVAQKKAIVKVESGTCPLVSSDKMVRWGKSSQMRSTFITRLVNHAKLDSVLHNSAPTSYIYWVWVSWLPHLSLPDLCDNHIEWKCMPWTQYPVKLVLVNADNLRSYLSQSCRLILHLIWGSFQKPLWIPLKCSPLNEIHIFQCMAKILCIELQREDIF